MRLLVTGTAGFIGFHLAKRLVAAGHSVVGLDGFTPYYDQSLKRARHEELRRFSNFAGHELMLEDAPRLGRLLQEAKPETVIHLAAQPGVRYAAENPRSYVESNVVGTFNLLEALRAHPCAHLMLASTSSVYGAASAQPFEERQSTDSPLSLYAATKKAAEALSYSYAAMFQLPTTIMRFFTVYGPWGRPDMALFKFTRNILEGKPIDVYGGGRMSRDFTYVDDAVEAIFRLLARAPAQGVSATPAPYQVVNVGSGHPILVNDFIAIIEATVGRKSERRDLPAAPGEMPSTWASTAFLEQLSGFRPATPIEKGVGTFVSWYRKYYCM
jgi:UDP-glucuronate 4-epimerase